MAVKNKKSKGYAVSYDSLCSILRNPKVANGLEAKLMNEVTMPDGIEFQFVKAPIEVKLSSAYGRNYFVKLQRINDNNTNVTVATQSRKPTVLLDTLWLNEVNKVFLIIDTLITD